MTVPPARQLNLALPDAMRGFTRAAYTVCGANRDAFAAVDAFAASGEPALAICGPEGSGKSHLAAILAGDHGSAPIDAGKITPAFGARAGLVVIDGAEGLASPARLLDLIETRRHRGLKLAIAGRGRPGDWARGLKDLETRLEAMARAALVEPDEALLRAVIAQGFAVRQWAVKPAVSAYAAPRIPRRFAAAQAFVAAAGAAAIADGRPITLAVARKTIANLFEAGPAA